jgi:hypothetical protein
MCAPSLARHLRTERKYAHSDCVIASMHKVTIPCCAKACASKSGIKRLADILLNLQACCASQPGGDGSKGSSASAGGNDSGSGGLFGGFFQDLASKPASKPGKASRSSRGKSRFSSLQESGSKAHSTGRQAQSDAAPQDTAPKPAQAASKPSEPPRRCRGKSRFGRLQPVSGIKADNSGRQAGQDIVPRRRSRPLERAPRRAEKPRISASSESASQDQWNVGGGVLWAARTQHALADFALSRPQGRLGQKLRRKQAEVDEKKRNLGAQHPQYILGLIDLSDMLQARSSNPHARSGRQEVQYASGKIRACNSMSKRPSICS